MNALRKNIRISMGLGYISLAALAFSHLALTDIAHGEPDVTLEWNTIRASALVILTFITFSVFTLRRVLGTLPG
jgi:hypothetical protein